MQGTAADIIKKAMLMVDGWIKAEANDVKMIMQVHDELVFEVPLTKSRFTVGAVREMMESAAELAVPLLVDIGTGNNWDEAH
jgi:DNA polymerase-1